MKGGNLYDDLMKENNYEKSKYLGQTKM